MLEFLRKVGAWWRVPLVIGMFALAYLILLAGAVGRRFSRKKERNRE